MERRLTQLEQDQDTPNTRDTNYCQHEYNPTQYHQHEYPRHQEFNCQLQHLTSNVRALEQQLTQHMCISTSLTTQLAMQLQQAMLTRQQTTTPNMVNANIPPAYGNLIRVITKLPNSEQSYKGKVKTHNYMNRQNQSTTSPSIITWDIRIVYNRTSHSSLHTLDIRHIVNNRTLHTRQDLQLLINNKIFHISPYLSDIRHISIKPPHNRLRCRIHTIKMDTSRICKIQQQQTI